MTTFLSYPPESTFGGVTRTSINWVNIFNKFKLSRSNVTGRPIADTVNPDKPVLGINVNVQGGSQSWRIIYGHIRTGGVITFVTTDVEGGGEFLHLLYTLAAHEIESVDAMYIEDNLVSFATPSDPFGWSTGDWERQVFLSKQSLGAQTVANSDMVSQSNILFPGKWTEDHIQKGAASAYVILYYVPSRYGSLGGIPDVKFEVHGCNQIYDPRDSTYKYTNNAALCTAHYLTNSSFGLGSDYSTRINEDVLIAAADICDETVGLHGGGSQARYKIDGIFDLTKTPRTIISQMAASMAGDVCYINGQWHIVPGKWRAPSITLTKADFRSDIQVDTMISASDSFNAIKGQYLSPEKGWQPGDFPPVVNSFYQSEDGEQVFTEVELALTTSSAMCQRIAKIFLEEQRQGITVNGLVTSLKAYELKPTDVVNLTVEDFGWNEKPFKIVDFSFATTSAQGSAPTIGCALNLRETAEGIYDWNDGQETVVDLAPNTNLPDPSVVGTPTDIVLESGTDQLDIRADGTIFSRIKVSWQKPQIIDPFDGSPIDNPFTDDTVIEIQFKKVSESTWRDSSPVPGTSTAAWILDVADGEFYEVRIRAKNSLGFTSDYLVSEEHQVIGKTAPPSNVTGFVAFLRDLEVRLQWNPISDLDLKHYEIRVGTDFVTSSTFVAEVRGTEFVYGARPAGSYNFLIKAVDTSDNKSSAATAAAFIIAAPAAPVVSFVIAGPNAVLSWTVPTGTFAIDSYEISYGATFEETIVTTNKTTTLERKVDWSGSRRWYVAATDVAGNIGSPGIVDIVIDPPSAVGNLRPEVVDNNVFLRWNEPTSGTLPIEKYKIYKGELFATSEFIGEAFATFFARSELVGGVFTYWIVAVDTAGNTSTEVETSSTVSEPADFDLVTDEEIGVQYSVKENVLVGEDEMRNVASLTGASSHYFTVADNTILDHTGSDSFTIVARVYPTTVNSANHTIVNKWTSSQNEYILRINSSNNFAITFKGDTGTTTTVTQSGSNNVTANNWYTVVAWLDDDDGKVRLQVNDGTVFESTHTDGIANSTAALDIGRSTDSGEYFSGYIGGVYLWKRALNSREITYVSDLGEWLSGDGFDEGLQIGYLAGWDFNEISDGSAAVTRQGVIIDLDLTDVNHAPSIVDNSDPYGTTDLPLGTLLAPIVLESYEDHFTNNSFTGPQDQIDSGYPIYIQPSNTSLAYIERVIDFGTTLSSIIVGITWIETPVAGTVTVTCKLAASEDGINFDSYTTASGIFANTLRAIKIRLEFSGADDTSLVEISDVRINAKVKQIKDSGAGRALATDVGGTTVTFNKTFVDVSGIVVNPMGAQRVPLIKKDWYLSVADNSDVSPGDIDFTFAGWVFFNTTTTNDCVFGKYYEPSNNREYLLEITSSKNFRWYMSGNGTAFTTLDATDFGPIPLRQWMFVVMGHSAASNYIFASIDSSAKQTTSHSAGEYGSGNQALVFGGQNTTAGAQFNGRLANWGLWHKELSDAEIAELFAGGIRMGLDEMSSGLQTSMVAFWPMDEASGTRADAVGSNDLTVTGTQVTYLIPKGGYSDFEDIPNPTEFKAIIFETDSGVRMTSDFAWQAEGFGAA